MQPSALSGCIISCFRTGLPVFKETTAVKLSFSTFQGRLLAWELSHLDKPFIKTPLRPQTHGEEELQLQLALAMSREEADAEETKKKSDDMRLTLAIQKSKAENSDKVVA